MKAVVLVGGFGTRLRPLTQTMPKQMLPIAGRTMIEWVVGRLAQFGVDEVVLSLGYRSDAFREAFPDGRIADVGYRVAVEPEPMGTAGAVKFAAEAAGLDEAFLVLNGDVLTDLDLNLLLEFHRSRPAWASIALQPVDDPSRFGVVPTDADGRVAAFVEKPEPGTEPTNLINAGTYVIEPEVLELIPNGRQVSIERETFPDLVARARLYAFGADTYWLDTGTPEQYLEANLDVVAGRRAGHQAPDTLAEIASSAYVRNSVIGAGTRIAGDAVVRGSVVMDDCVIGAGAVVEDSVLSSGVVVGAQSRLRNMCVIGKNETVPPGVSLDAVRQPAPE